jgi:hypothetical protein
VLIKVNFTPLKPFWGGWLTPRSSRFIPRKETLYPLHKRLGAPQVSAKTGGENFAPTGIGSLDRPARSESLYVLSHTGPPGYVYVRCKLSFGIIFGAILVVSGLTTLSHLLRLMSSGQYITNTFLNRAESETAVPKIRISESDIAYFETLRWCDLLSKTVLSFFCHFRSHSSFTTNSHHLLLQDGRKLHNCLNMQTQKVSRLWPVLSPVLHNFRVS